MAVHTQDTGDLINKGLERTTVEAEAAFRVCLLQRVDRAIKITGTTSRTFFFTPRRSLMNSHSRPPILMTWANRKAKWKSLLPYSNRVTLKLAKALCNMLHLPPQRDLSGRIIKMLKTITKPKCIKDSQALLISTIMLIKARLWQELNETQ